MTPIVQPAPPRGTIAAVFVGLFASLFTGMGQWHTLSGMAGTGLGALSFYCLFAFYFRTSGSSTFLREPSVHLWQPAVLVVAVAVASWVPDLRGLPILASAMQFTPLVFLLALFFGPWKLLIPRAKDKTIESWWSEGEKPNNE